MKVRTLISTFKNNHPKLYWLAGIPLALLSFGFVLLICLILCVYLGYFGELPSTSTIQNVETPEASWLLDREGQVLSRYYKQNRENIEFEELSPDLLGALLSTEDERFFEHEGVDWIATSRAVLFSGILGKTEQGGGSTLSQQIAKNHFPRQKSGLFNLIIDKIKESITASRFEDAYEKEELLALYFNTVPFGENMYGIKVASNRFFGVDPIDLKVEEAAVLVGLLKGNSSYHPVWHPEKCLKRRNLVLGRMVKQDLLTQQAFDSLSLLPLKLNESKSRARSGTSHLSQRAKSLVLDILHDKYPDVDVEQMLITEGLRIYTSIWADVQYKAESALQKHLAELQGKFQKHWKDRTPEGFDEILDLEIQRSKRFKQLLDSGKSEQEARLSFAEKRLIKFTKNAAFAQQEVEASWRDSLKAELMRLRSGLIIADPHTQELLAYVGGAQYSATPFDGITAKRQVGSTFKPIVYTAALEKGITPCTYFANKKITYTDYNNWTPENALGKYGGQYSLTGGLINSVNTIAVQLAFETQPSNIAALAEAMQLEGIEAFPSIALGTPSLSLEDMIRVYGTFARRGSVPDFEFVTRIETKTGEVLYEREAPKEAEPIFSESTAATIDYMLRQVALQGTGRGLSARYGVRSEVACKTGTTQNQADGWFMGYTSDFVFGAWVGGAYPSIRWRNLSLGQGSRTALPIVGNFIHAYEKDHGKSILPAVSDTVLAYLNCPNFLTEEEAIALEQQKKQEDLKDLFGRIFGQSKTENKKPAYTGNRRYKSYKSTRSQSAEQKRAALIRKREQERMRKRKQRKEKLRQVFEKVFNGN